MQARAHARAHARTRTGTRTQARAHIRTRTHAHACTQATHARQGGRAHAMRRWGHQEAAGATITHQLRHRHHRHGLAPTSDRASGRHAAPWPASALDGPSWDRSPGQLADILASALDGLGRRWPAPFQAEPSGWAAGWAGTAQLGGHARVGAGQLGRLGRVWHIGAFRHRIICRREEAKNHINLSALDAPRTRVTRNEI